MQIVRINKIKNVGQFADCRGDNLEFKKLTLIYGLNTYGKTTLTDIFRSLKDNNPQIIARRERIPRENEPQKDRSQEIELTYKIGGTENERKVKFEDGMWVGDSISDHLEVFGTDFVDKNLYTGLEEGITRTNKENFTTFILWKEGVDLVRQISAKRSERATLRNFLNGSIPPFVRGDPKERVATFVKSTVYDKEENEKELELKRRELGMLDEPQRILNLSVPVLYAPPEPEIVHSLREIDRLLKMSYNEINERVQLDLQKHIREHFSTEEDAEGWIRKGLKFCKDVNRGGCPFCGQSLESAEQLMDIYKSYFSKAYKNFADEIQRLLTQKYEEVRFKEFNEQQHVQIAWQHASAFSSFIREKDFQARLAGLRNLINSLNESTIKNSKNIALQRAVTAIREKIASPYKQIIEVDFEQLIAELNLYQGKLNRASAIIKDLRMQIENFKNQYANLSEIQNKRNNVEKQIGVLEYRRARIEQNQNCKKYQEIEEKLQVLEKELSEGQSRNLGKYFEEINQLFEELGSEGFTLEKEVEEKIGNLPVYSLGVKFRGKHINNNNLNYVFGESDRRALALAVFWSKINLKTDAEKLNLVVILDDPITSFDDNRILNSINLFKKGLGKISQMIILTHYPNFKNRIYKLVKSKDVRAKYLEVNQPGSDRLLSEMNPKDFMKDEYEITFMKIHDFINRNSNEDIKRDLRGFVERHYFQKLFPFEIVKEITETESDISRLNIPRSIDKIFEKNPEARDKFQAHWNTLNDIVHPSYSGNEEDIRAFARELMKDLYSNEFLAGRTIESTL